MRMRQTKKPAVMNNLSSRMQAFKKAKVSELTRAIAQELSDMGLDAKATPRYVIATEAKMRKKGVLDLKPYFARSSKRKLKKHGGWYMVIPISVKARSFATSTIYKRALKEAHDLDAGETTTVGIKGFLEGRTQNTLGALQYKPKSNKLTISKNETGKRTSYTAFRTVSDKSPANSWIVGRENMNTNNTSKTLSKQVEQMLNWKFKHIMGGR